MHPIIRVISYLVVATGLAFGARDVVPALASFLTLAVQEGVAATPSTVRIVASGAPPPPQWLCPAVLATLFMAVQMPL
ncbi:MAG: hypothetical protein ACT4QB_23390 [Gammaproteobacteria bacterium]